MTVNELIELTEMQEDKEKEVFIRYKNKAEPLSMLEDSLVLSKGEDEYGDRFD